MNSKIIQIIPAPANLFAEYRNEENPSGNAHEWPVLCLGLTGDGDTVAMTIDATGIVGDATHASNFSRIYFK